MYLGFGVKGLGFRMTGETARGPETAPLPPASSETRRTSALFPQNARQEKAPNTAVCRVSGLGFILGTNCTPKIGGKCAPYYYNSHEGIRTPS